jgi:hypothetical protein
MTPGSIGARRDLDAIAIATWAVLAVGVALRVVAYLQRSVLWLDEAATARNVVERSFGELMTVPLDYGQAAPKGFLLLEWLVTRVAGASDVAFRFVPFAAGVASVLVFLAIARRLLTPAGTLAALLFFSVGYWFLVYASDVHPYGLDLALSLAALLLVLDARRLGYPRRRIWALAAFGALAVWFSNSVVLALFGLGVALGAIAWRERGLRAAAEALWPLALAWGVSAAAAVWVAKRSFFPAAAEFFDWTWAAGMVPVPRSVDSALWLWRAWRGQLSLWHGWSVDDPVWTSLYVALSLIGFASLLRRRTADAILAGSVIAAFVLVSMARQYPYDARFVLAPLAIFMLGIGEPVGVLAAARWGRATPLAQGLAVAVCVPPVYRIITFPPPYQWTVTGAYLGQMRERWRSGDVIYTTYGRALEVMYHAPRFGFAAGDYLVGPCDHADPRTALRAVDALRGRPRVWTIVGTGRYFPQSPEYSYLRSIGIRRDSLRVSLPGSLRAGRPEPFDIGTAYLFDLSDPTRLARATAETYEFSPLLRRGLRGMNRWNCYGVWAPNVRESAAGRGARGSGRGEVSSP